MTYDINVLWHEYYTKYSQEVESDLNVAFIDYIESLGTITETTIQGEGLIAV